MLCTHSYIFVEQSPSWEANSSSACWEIPSSLWILKVHYHTHNILPPVPLLSQINPDHVPSYFLNVHLIFLYLLCLGLPIGLFPSGFPTKSHAPVLLTLTSHIPSPFFLICSCRYYLLRSMDHKAYRYVVLHSPVPRRPNTFLSTLFSNTLSPCSPSVWVFHLIPH